RFWIIRCNVRFEILRILAASASVSSLIAVSSFFIGAPNPERSSNRCASDMNPLKLSFLREYRAHPAGSKTPTQRKNRQHRHCPDKNWVTPGPSAEKRL